jgi:hypothetical protein
MLAIPLLSILASALLFQASIAVDVPESNFIPPRTVDSLNADAYLGRWFLMYSSLIPKATYLHGGYCAVADYADLTMEQGKISFSVLNSMR